MTVRVVEKNGGNGRNGSQHRSAPAHFSDSWLLGFYFGEVSPRLDRKLVWPDLRERGNRLEDAPCAKCKKTDTFTYQDSQVLHCAHKNSCGMKESILERLAGCVRPSGARLLDAIQEAARLAGVLMPKKDITPEEQEAARLWGLRKDCLEAAAAWAQDELWGDSESAIAARAYLAGRGLTGDEIRELHLGLFTTTARLRDRLSDRKLSSAVAKDAALLRGNLEGYIVFPWWDEHGNILTLYGRWPGNNLPEKSAHAGYWKDDGKALIPKTYALPGDGTKADPLYFDRVKKARCREVVLVEGVIDAAIAQVKGDSRVCAYVAATLAEKQVEALARYRPDSVIVCPDPDAGGDKGVLSTVARLGEARIRAYVAPRLPDSMDPDQFILAHGIDAWKQHLERSSSAPLYLAARELADMDRTLPAKRREEALRKVVDILAGLDGEGASLDKSSIIKLACEKLGYAKSEISAELGKRRKVQRDTPKAKVVPLRGMSGRSEADPDSWRSRLMWTETQTGAYLTKNLANALTILSHHPDWEGVLAFDEFAQKTVALKAPPSHGRAFEPQSYPHKWGDHDDALAAAWLQRGEPVLDIEVSVASRAVAVVAQLRKIHPVKEYLESLSWDGTPRIDAWLATYCRGESIAGNEDYLREVGSKWLIAAVARIYQPGCKVDTVLVLEGAQGFRKSTAFRILGGPWFTDELADVGSKDAAVQLQGMWLIELAELDALSKAESAKIKSFFTRTTERYVPKYARHPVEVPRQCVFAGTVNPDTYLKDETGNRRFWPVRCVAKIDVEALQRDRDQIWAEAVSRYKNGTAWHLDQSLEGQARSEQDARYQADAWESLVEAFVLDRQRVTIQQILGSALRLEHSEWGQSEQNRAARCLKRLGWERKRVRVKRSELDALGLSGSSTDLVWVYARPPEPREPGEEG